ncbi:MAG: DEAD/DEAH box helicase [Planctomycetota bacterium]
MTSEDTAEERFDALGLPAPLLATVDALGYERPSPIQARTIPSLLAGRDVVGQAQTGTGKTAAFALPILAGLDLAQKRPQALVLVPTRELAIQVAEAFQTYARNLPGFHVLPVYGGQAHHLQLRPLARGVHVVVGTPGRVMDHMRQNTLVLDGLKTLVLDEADEMLRMGFIEDVEWILDQTPKERRTALFSATMPDAIRRIADRHLRDPETVTIKVNRTNAANIRQRFWIVRGVHKLDALTRILEAEDFDGIIIFVRTRTQTTHLAEKLEARGFASAPLSGEMAQTMRERTVERLKSGKLDILVATDVAARGLDVDRISHVVNFDLPYDVESYVHRIGRTGRAGRKGEAILFVSPRETRMLRTIETATGGQIERMTLPTTDEVNRRRVDRFKERIIAAMAAEKLATYRELIEELRDEQGYDPVEMAAALAKMAEGDRPLLLEEEKPERKERRERRDDQEGGRERPVRERAFGGDLAEEGATRRGPGPAAPRGPEDRPRRGPNPLEPGMERFRVEVGRIHGVRPADIVGAIASEAGLEGREIGRIEIYPDHCTVDLPEGMPRPVFQFLKKVRVCNRPLRITRIDAPRAHEGPRRDDRERRGGPGRDHGKPRRHEGGPGRGPKGGPKRFGKKPPRRRD